MSVVTRHLDLGCGTVPRNPTNALELYGLDLRGAKMSAHPRPPPGVWKWNVVREALPFPDNFFTSCSAYDFLEHVPRAWPNVDGVSVQFTFVDLMSEIYRVLRPGGLFLAATPAIPKPETFVDPTHINFLTKKSHQYFCGASPMARMYGFEGRFTAEMVEFGIPKFLNTPCPPSWSRRTKVFWRLIRGNPIPHLLWRLRAEK